MRGPTHLWDDAGWYLLIDMTPFTLTCRNFVKLSKGSNRIGIWKMKHEHDWYDKLNVMMLTN